MSKCNDKFNGNDKAKHFLVCLIIAAINPFIAILCAMGKELHDMEQPNNHFCWKDMVANAVGIAMGTIIFCLWW